MWICMIKQFELAAQEKSKTQTTNASIIQHQRKTIKQDVLILTERVKWMKDKHNSTISSVKQAA